MKKNKPYSIAISKLLLLVFFIPMMVLSMHSMEDHKHEVCNSKETTHLHHKDIECKLHLAKIGNSQLDEYNYQFSSKEKFAENIDLITHFLPNYQQLSFSLRAPPLSVLL